ncbi:two-component system sensor histidine kinase NtrB [Bacillus sp. USDA818B3_A]|uniref:two-component system sensor histidine kinase NtrB n=1 Tax=Bacillus sp. USDA818B3_A TaxID=2698834 RepID=UPI00136EB7D8|nr:ATP-binding protein [Bacillus sp. USDA818B3_A]
MILDINSKPIDFHQLIEHSFNSILIVETSGQIVYCNKACFDLLKLTKSADIIHQDIRQFLPPDFQKICMELLTNIHDNQKTIKAEVKMLGNDGEIIDIDSLVAPFHLENQIYVQIIMQNITDRKKTEKELNDREKLASLGQIAAGIAHEVKNPLTAVKGFLQLIKESDTNPYLDIMEDELNKALSTLENLLHVSKPDLLNEPLVTIDLCKELSSLINLFQDKLYNIELKVHLIYSEHKMIGKRNLLQKAFFNLIKNAIEALEEGKGTITIEHYYEDESIHIVISDSGVGIPQEKIKMLGTPFFTSKPEGTGLGLTQVVTTIHEHDGKISFQSEVDKGTTISIQLPVRRNI